MRKIFQCLLMAAIILSAVPLLAGCSSTAASDITSAPFALPSNLAELQAQATEVLKFEECEGGYEITSYYGRGVYEVWLPEEYNGKPVVRLGKQAFRQRENLVSVYIPASITEVGSYCFSKCTNLQTVYFAEGFKNPGEGMFNECENLTKVYIPRSMTALREHMFDSCGFESIVIPSHIKEIGRGCFQKCANLKSIVLPKGLEIIKADTFYHCTSLTDITIPNSVKRIEYFAFTRCDSLASIKLPQQLETIESLAFSSCKRLTRIRIPKNVEVIGLTAFEDCELTVYAPHEAFYYLGFPEEYLEYYTQKYQKWLADQGAPKRYVESEEEHYHYVYEKFIEMGFAGVIKWVVV